MRERVPISDTASLRPLIEPVVASIYFRLLLTREELDEPFLESLTGLLAAGVGSRPEKAP
jgi:hypothetical protein